MKYLLGIVALILLIVFVKTADKNQENGKAGEGEERTEIDKQAAAREFQEKADNNEEVSLEDVRRLTVSLSYKRELEEKKEHFQKNLKQIIPRFKHSNSISEIIDELKESSGLDLKLLSSTSPGYSFDESYKPLEEDFFLSKKFSFDFENMPSGEIIRYLAISANLKYKVDEENQEVILSEPGVILHDNFSNLSVDSDSFNDLKDYEFNSAEQEAPTEFDIKLVRKALESKGVHFPAGSEIHYEKGKYVFTVPEEEQQKLLEALNNK